MYLLMRSDQTVLPFLGEYMKPKTEDCSGRSYLCTQNERGPELQKASQRSQMN